MHMCTVPFTVLTATSIGFSMMPLAVPLYNTENCPSNRTSDSWMLSLGNSHFGSISVENAEEIVGLVGEGGSSEEG